MKYITLEFENGTYSMAEIVRMAVDITDEYASKRGKHFLTYVSEDTKTAVR